VPVVLLDVRPRDPRSTKIVATAVAETTPRPVARPIRSRTLPQSRSRRAPSRPASGGKSSSSSPLRWCKFDPRAAPLDDAAGREFL